MGNAEIQMGNAEMQLLSSRGAMVETKSMYLQGDTERECGLEGLLVTALGRSAHDGHCHQSNRASNSVAIEVELVERLEAILVEIHHHALRTWRNGNGDRVPRWVHKRELCTACEW